MRVYLYASHWEALGPEEGLAKGTPDDPMTRSADDCRMARAARRSSPLHPPGLRNPENPQHPRHLALEDLRDRDAAVSRRRVLFLEDRVAVVELVERLGEGKR